MAKQNNTKVVTGIVRLSYANIWDPKAPVSGGDPRYSCSLIIPKSDTETVDAINRAIDCAIQEGIGKFGGKIPNKAALKLPLRDGDRERPGDEAYKDAYFLNASSTSKPGLVGRDCTPLIDSSEWYSGISGKASINFFAFNTNGNRGIACGLNNLQKLKDGTPLGGHSRPEDDFDVEDDDDDDFLS